MSNLPRQLRPEVTALLDCFSVPAVLLRHDYVIMAANQAYRRAFGDGQPLMGRHCYELSHYVDHPCSMDGCLCPLDTSAVSGQVQQAVRCDGASGEGRDALVDIYPIRNERGEVVYFLELLTLSAKSGSSEGPVMVGRSSAFLATMELIRRVAGSEAAVMLLGESGTGKELAALAVHQASPRRKGPFVAVDCSGLTETLFESELFGHEKGAFTGAHSRKVGLVEAAQGGTLFLDEIGDVPVGLQVKLLRLLETGTFRRVGGVEPIRADFRLVSATHRDLGRMVEDGGFRQDLYYRINTFPIHIPPLRGRLDDLPLLAEMLLKRSPSGRGLRLHEDTLRALRAYDFPGNIRELRNLLERASLLADGEWILPEHLPPHVLGAARAERVDRAGIPGMGGIIPLSDLERRYLQWASHSHRGDRKSLARSLGVSERTLYRKLEALKLEVAGERIAHDL